MNDFNEWSPHMDVAESGSDYVVTIELPGVSASTIWVEANDERLVVTEQCSTEWWRDGNEKYAIYHKRELLEGPYHVVWHLPSNNNKDVVSVEFVWASQDKCFVSEVAGKLKVKDLKAACNVLISRLKLF